MKLHALLEELRLDKSLVLHMQQLLTDAGWEVELSTEYEEPWAYRAFEMHDLYLKVVRPGAECRVYFAKSANFHGKLERIYIARKKPKDKKDRFRTRVSALPGVPVCSGDDPEDVVAEFKEYTPEKKQK